MENLITKVTKTSFACTNKSGSKDIFIVEERDGTSTITVWEGCLGKTYECSLEDIIGGFKMSYKTVIQTNTTVSTSIQQNITHKS